MVLISVKDLDDKIIRELSKLKINQTLRVESWKGNRYIEIKKLNIMKYEFYEKGYREIKDIIDNFEKLKDYIRKAIDIEFPRSIRVRIKVY